MDAPEKRGLFVLGVYTFLLIAILIVLTRLCFIIDSKLAYIQDPGRWLLARQVIDGYLGCVLPRNANVEYGRPPSEPRSAFPKRIYFPIIQAGIPNNPAAYRRTPTTAYVWHTPMIPTPFVMFAPAPYESGNDVAHAYHNLQQFRYPEDLKAKDSDEIRIFVTGGSTAWGYAAPDLNSTISGFMEALLACDTTASPFRIKVINAAAGGFTTTQERIWFQNRIMPYEPDIIISYSGFNDVYAAGAQKVDLLNRLNNDGLYYLNAIQEYELYNRGEAPVRSMKKYDEIFFNRSNFPGHTISNIETIALQSKQHGIHFIFILQPYNKLPRFSYPIESYYAVMAAALQEASGRLPFTFIDHTRLFDGRYNLFLDDCHLGDLGYEIIAKAILNDIQPLIRRVLDARRIELTAGRTMDTHSNATEKSFR